MENRLTDLILHDLYFLLIQAIQLINQPINLAIGMLWSAAQAAFGSEVFWLRVVLCLSSHPILYISISFQLFESTRFTIFGSGARSSS